MIRILLPASIFLLTVTTAKAQKSDSLVTSASDSLRHAQPPLCKLVTTQSQPSYLPLFTTIQPILSRIAGVQVTPYSGAPGAWAAVRIRGVANVTGNSQPLYVVDDVPVYNTEITPEKWTAAYLFFNSQGQQYTPSITTPFTPSGNPLLDMPVEDVESVEVIKGAAATARYGMQGTNGVIRINTRRGANGRAILQPLRVRYAGWGGVQQVRQRYDLLNAQQYAALANVAAANNSRPAPYTPADLTNLGPADWQDRAFHTAGIQNHNISLDGLGQHTRYYVAADYLNQTGVVVNSHLSRYSLRANVDQQLTPKLLLSLKAAGSRLDQHQPSFEPDAGSFLRNVLLAPPALNSGNNPQIKDPLPSAIDVYRTPRTYRILTQLGATYTFSPDLLLSVRGSFEQVDVRAPYHRPDFSYSTTYTTYTETATTHAHNWVREAVLRYQHTFRERHALTTSLSYLGQKLEQRLKNREDSYTTDTRSQMLNDGHGYREFSQSWHPTSAVHSPTAVVNYSYAGRYEIGASLRSDFVNNAYDKFEHYWFPGAELRWHLGKEAFLADVAWLSALTLQTGVGRTSSYFTPDRTTQYDAGLHLGMLGNKLTLDATFYQRRTQNAQALLTLPVSNGYDVYYLFPTIALQNRGLELSLGSYWQLGKVQGSSTLAAATNHNRITESNISTNGSLAGKGLEKDGSVGQFFAYEQDGTYPVGSPKAGQIRYRDRNNDGQVDDGYYQGSGLPRYTLNLYQQLRIQRFQLEAQLDGLFGYQLLNTTLASLDNPWGYYNTSMRALNYWTPANQNTSIPRPGLSQPSTLSSQALASGNHLRLSQLKLSYTLPSTGTRNLSVWLGGQNLFVTGRYRGFDPNVSAGGAAPLQAGQDASVYPVARVWQLGLRATL